MVGSGCGSVGKAVASDTRGLRFESSHPQNLYWTLITVNCIEKTKIKKKEAGNSPFLEYLMVALEDILGTSTITEVDNPFFFSKKVNLMSHFCNKKCSVCIPPINRGIQIRSKSFFASNLGLFPGNGSGS